MVSSLSLPRGVGSRTKSADAVAIVREPGCDDVGAIGELPVDTTLENAPF